MALLSTGVLEIQLCWIWKLKEMVFNTARYVQGMCSMELAETLPLVEFADLDAVRNFPVKSKARLTTVYCLYLGLHNRVMPEQLNARNTLYPAFWGLSELGTTTFCSCWYERQRIDGSLTLAFFCNILKLFIPEIVMSVGYFFPIPLCLSKKKGYKISQIFCPEITSELTSAFPLPKTKQNQQ